MRRLFFSLAVLTVVFGASQTFAAIQWSVADGGNGHWYEAVLADEPVSVSGPAVVDGFTLTGYSGGITWTEARDAATAKGGWLVDINSAEENAFVFSLVTSDMWYAEMGYGIGLGPWIGGFQPEGSPEPAGNWQWVTGIEFTDASGSSTQYTNWYPAQPRNHYQIPGSGPPEDALHFYGNSPGWQDLPSWAPTNGYIVEYSSNPAVPEPSTFIVWSLLSICALVFRRR